MEIGYVYRNDQGSYFVLTKNNENLGIISVELSKISREKDYPIEISFNRIQSLQNTYCNNITVISTYKELIEKIKYKILTYLNSRKFKFYRISEDYKFNIYKIIEENKNIPEPDFYNLTFREFLEAFNEEVYPSYFINLSTRKHILFFEQLILMKDISYLSLKKYLNDFANEYYDKCQENLSIDEIIKLFKLIFENNLGNEDLIKLMSADILKALSPANEIIANEKLSRIISNNFLNKYSDYQLERIINKADITKLEYIQVEALILLKPQILSQKLILDTIEIYMESNFEEIKKTLLTYLNEIENKEEFFSLLPFKIRYNLDFFQYFSGTDQIKYFKKIIIRKFKKYWHYMKVEAKIHYLYSISKEYYHYKYYGINSQINFPDIYLTIEEYINKEFSKDELEVKAIATLLIAINDPRKEYMHRLFEQAFFDYINHQVIKNVENIIIHSRLPSCLVDEAICKYCEAKPWSSNPYAYCPRLKGRCDIGITFYKNSGAQISANFNSKEWGLFELYEFSGVKHNLINIESHFINKLSGWVNRVIEIQERLKCKSCNSVLESNWNYSKNFTAVYNNTIVRCKNSNCIKYTKDIYLSHCQACKEIIDSRDNNVKNNNYYLCLHCGAGEDGVDIPGKYCPKCGGTNMNQKENTRKYKCNSCYHVINLTKKYISIE